MSRLDRIIAQLHRQTLSTGARVRVRERELKFQGSCLMCGKRGVSLRHRFKQVHKPGEEGPHISDLEAQIHSLHAAVQDLQVR